MPDFKEIKFSDAQHLRNSDHLLESKIDGCCMTWTGTELLSERGCERSDRFPHIVKELKQLPWKVQGEVAVPFGHVLTLNKKENWGKTRFYGFKLLESQGQPIIGDPVEVRKELEKLFKNNSFQHLRLPFKWNNFDNAWKWVKKYKGEGLVFKPLDGTTGFKLKDWKEAKLQIVGFTPGKEKGAFQLQCKSGAIGSVSGTSIAYVDKYTQLISQGEVWVEIEYLFLTDEGKPFQPRLRRLDTKAEIFAKA